MKQSIFISLIFSVTISSAQQLGPLTVEKIMRDPKWIGTSPKNPTWSTDSKYLFFQWNPEKATSDSTYYITTTDLRPKKASFLFRQSVPAEDDAVYNSSHSAYAFTRNGDIFYFDARTNKTTRVTQTVDPEVNPKFIENDTKLAYSRNQNLFSWDIASGTTEQLTNFQKGNVQREQQQNAQEKWLQQNQLETSEILRERKERREKAEAITKANKPKELRTIYLGDRNVFNIYISPSGRFITYLLVRQPQNAKNTIIPDYVTESGFTTDINGRTKVGAPATATELFVFDRVRDTVMQVKTDKIPGINDQPDYLKEYKKSLEARDTAHINGRRDSAARKNSREVRITGPIWNDKGTNALVEVRSLDNKDRWLMLLDPETATLKLLDRQRDEAWIGGPGTAFGFNLRNLWIDDNTFWYQSEASGYSHLYKMNIVTGQKTQLTSGKFEVQQAQLSKEKKTFYITTNAVHPGEKQFYQLPVTGGTPVRITTLTGANQVNVSPDEKYLAILYSYSNKPWELFLQENRPGGKLQQVTNLAQSEEFKSYAWRDPELITFKASDGAEVYARVYQPKTQHASKPAVIFVHGAGYLQNAHKWWSDYFREYMFNNLLADNGYVVMDIDYRGSAGYGRDWRTGIYRFMGGKDLSDHVDAAKYMAQKYGVNPKNIGIYGGSYGGYITLMGMFTTPDVFKSGAALRSVVDWAHYNHGYTSNILNEPINDSIAYRKSSPIYYAEGLKGNLLMCHGMVDVNVHFQDIVRLTQRLIELHKENWELAVYPVEDHGFVEPSSWTDEYKRVLKLFETTLKKE